jgi:hypothetical protein
MSSMLSPPLGFWSEKVVAGSAHRSQITLRNGRAAAAMIAFRPCFPRARLSVSTVRLAGQGGAFRRQL